MKVIYLRTNLPNMRLALAFNKDPCDFVLFENDLAQSDLTDVLTPPFTVDDENIDGDDFELYEMTDIILYSNMNLNLPLQVQDMTPLNLGTDPFDSNSALCLCPIIRFSKIPNFLQKVALLSSVQCN